VQNGHRCGRIGILFAVVAIDLLLHHGVDGAATVYCDCGVAAKENHHHHHERLTAGLRKVAARMPPATPSSSASMSRETTAIRPRKTMLGSIYRGRLRRGRQ